ncbi:oligosaccharide repeat unit polymerase [Citrobacter sp. MGH106]|uniref:oligosaccharide repeat unit polymerase n=1 Tax=Citrobacter sp. MGH106 TaxID=1686381 RepID=UPI0006520F8C|nr:oligosaccharide repeat unit polymerase [Citrobacter sp. MGH106]KLV66330.1 hypothetical protein SK36_01040 [Citrobacter sp. MGH106]
MVAFTFVAMSILFVIFIYFLCLRKERKVINIMTPYLLITFPILYVFEIVYLSITKDSINTVGYIFFYTCYLISILFFTVFYLYSQDIKIPPYKKDCVVNIKIGRYSFFAFLFTIMSIVFYLPVILEFKDLLLQPRRIYEQTRTGYGVYFYTSIVLSQIALLFSFYLLNKKTLYSSIIIISNVLLILIHGNKGPLIIAFVSYLMFQSYVLRKEIKIKYLLIACGFLAALVSLFFIYTYDNNNNVFINMAYYSDYTRNAVLLMTKDWSFEYGRLMLESEIYSRIPRALLPSKPEDFGYLYIAKVLYPIEFYRNQGAPAFGYGEYYADFGLYTPLYLAISGAVKGVIAKYFHNMLLKDNNIYVFIPFIFSCGVGIIPVSMGYLLPEHLFIAFSLYILINIVAFVSRGRRKSFTER